MRRAIVILSALLCAGYFAPVNLTAQSLNSICNQPRGRDQLVKRMINVCEPGECGTNKIWDFSELKFQNANYALEYKATGSDTIIGIEHHTMYYYRNLHDSLFCLGYENPTTTIIYHKPELILTFPTFRGRVTTDYFDGIGNYCGRLNIRLRGKSTVEADASGTLILPEGDTLFNVLRVYTHKLIHQRLFPRHPALDSVQSACHSAIFYRDSIDYLLFTDSIRHETETWRWYADGYRYPILETVKSIVYKLSTPHEHFSTSFLYLPEEQYYDLPFDTDNQKRRDQIAEEIYSRDWENTNNNSSNNRNGKDISYNFNIEEDGNLYISYDLKEPGKIFLTVYDLQGRQLKSVQHTNQAAGNYKEVISMTNFQRGEYLLQIVAGDCKYGEKIIKF